MWRRQRLDLTASSPLVVAASYRTSGPDNVRVNTVLPGWVATERQLSKWWSEEGEAGTMRYQARKRRIIPAEFAQMVLFLAADDGGACTAQQFLVDGGRR